MLEKLKIFFVLDFRIIDKEVINVINNIKKNNKFVGLDGIRNEI